MISSIPSFILQIDQTVFHPSERAATVRLPLKLLLKAELFHLFILTPPSGQFFTLQLHFLFCFFTLPVPHLHRFRLFSPSSAPELTLACLRCHFQPGCNIAIIVCGSQNVLFLRPLRVFVFVSVCVRERETQEAFYC